MDLPMILIIVGIIIVIASFFFGHTNASKSEDIEQVSMSLHQETSAIKKRLRTVEEELMIGIGSMEKKTASKPIHEIIVNQILSLNAQGYSIEDIAHRSSLSTADVQSVLRSKGVN